MLLKWCEAIRTRYEAKNVDDASGIGEAFQRRSSPVRPHTEYAGTAVICCVEALEWGLEPIHARFSSHIVAVHRAISIT
jgi:hypothetical protein